MKKLYTIATSEKVTVGHGWIETEVMIKEDIHGKYPPVYPTKDLAHKYLNNLKFKFNKIVVELELIE